MDRASHRYRDKCHVTCSKKVLTLIARMEETGATQGAQPKEWPELRTLREMCCSTNVAEAFAAFQGLTLLVERRILVGSQTLSALISLLPSVQHYTPLIMTVGDILLFEIKENEGQDRFQYNFNDKLHPFVTILNHDAEKSWDSIFYYIHHLLYNKEDIKLKSKIQMLKPALLYIFINPAYNSLSYKCEVFDLLIEQADKPEIKFLIFELFAWQKMDMNYCRLLKKMLDCFINSPREQKKTEVVASLIPFLCSAIKWLILYSHNPLLWIDLLAKCLDVVKDGCSVALYILSDVFQQTPVCFLNRLAEVCSTIIYTRSCNKYVAHKFHATSILWMINPLPAEEPLLKILENVMKLLAFECEPSDWTRRTTELNINPYFKILKNSLDDVKFAFDMSTITDSWNDEAPILKWMNYLLASDCKHVQATLQTFISGILISENDDELLDVCVELLLKTCNINNILSHYCICIMFYKLSRESEPKSQLRYLRALARMADAQDSMPKVIGIIEILKNKNELPNMLPTVIDLYLRIWRRDRRVYPYLHRALFALPGGIESSWEMSTIKSLAIREICESSPDVHGKGLVSKLSDVLNNSDEHESGIPTALAIEAVIYLCRATVIDIAGTWKTLRPKLIHDKRTAVVVRLCKLFAEIPGLRHHSPARMELLSDVVPRLWEYVFSGDLEVTKAALAALAEFHTSTYGPKLFPDILKTDILLTKQHFKASKEIPKKDAIDQLEYVPGECWIECLYKVDSRARTDAGNMLKLLIENDLQTLPRRFFCLPEDMAPPENYSHLAPSSILRAAECHIKDYLRAVNPGQKRVSAVITEILRIFSMDYYKILPCINWTFVTRFLTLNEECKRYAVLIMIKQSSSKGAKQIFENYLLDNLSKFNDVEEFLFMYSALHHICNCLSPNTLRQFLEKTFKSAFQSSLRDGPHYFDHVLKTSTALIDSKSVPESRKLLLISQLQNILALIPPEHELMKVYANYAHLLPPKTFECITCPGYWPQITSEKIRQSVLIRAAAVARPDSFKLMSAFSDLLDTVCHFPSESEIFVVTVLEVLPKVRRLNNAGWFLELLSKIENSSSKLSLRGSVAVTLFFLDLFIIGVITTVGYDCLLLEKELHVIKSNSLKIFPLALYKFLMGGESCSAAPKVFDCMYKLAKWKKLPLNYAQVLEQALLINRENLFVVHKNKWPNYLYFPMEIK